MEKEEWYNKEGIITNQSIKVKNQSINKVSSQISKYLKKYHHKLYIIYYYIEYTSIYLKSIEKSTLYCDDTFLGKMKTK